jgi:hypothetical protein
MRVEDQNFETRDDSSQEGKASGRIGGMKVGQYSRI